MYCPNCGLANDSGARFCANCGTTLGDAPVPPVPNPPPYQQPGPYPVPGPAAGSNSILKNIGIGCLVAVAIVLFVGLSCTRACFGSHRRGYVIRHY